MTGRRVGTAALVAGILLFAVNMRGPIVAVSPVLHAISADLGISAGVAGLLTSLPVLCFGLATPLASWLLARSGLERGMLLALAGLLVGIGIRSADGVTGALAGTLVLGLAITVGNVAIPVVIGRDLPRRASPMLGAYAIALNVGSVLTLTLTVPLATALGWRWALVTWGWLVVVAAAVWWWSAPHRASRAPDAVPDGNPDGDEHPVWWRRTTVWALTVAFAGQAFAYYAMTAWLPTLLHDERGLDPATAGAGASLFQIAAVAGAVGVPALLHRWPGGRRVIAAVVAAWLALAVGLLLLPSAWAVWCTLGGVAQGGGLTVIFSLIVAKARSTAENRQMSALVQGGGYTVAASGPPIVGAVHQATGGWTVALLIVLGAIAVLAVAGTLAARPAPASHIDTPAAPGR